MKNLVSVTEKLHVRTYLLAVVVPVGADLAWSSQEAGGGDRLVMLVIERSYKGYKGYVARLTLFEVSLMSAASSRGMAVSEARVMRPMRARRKPKVFMMEMLRICV